MGTTETTLKSRILDPVEAFLGFQIENCVDEEFTTSSKDTLLTLRDKIGTVLGNEWGRLGGTADHVIPITQDPWALPASLDCKNQLYLSLLHKQIVLPMRSLKTEFTPDYHLPKFKRKDHETYEIGLMVKFILWMRDHAALLRSGALFPISQDVFSSQKLSHFSFRAANRLDVSKLGLSAQEIAPVVDGLSKRQASDVLRMYFSDLVEKLVYARKFNTIPVMADVSMCKLWNAVVTKELAPYLKVNKSGTTASTIFEFNMALGALPYPEIIALHSQSEAFANWRYHLRTVLNNIRGRVEQGTDTDTALREEIVPLKEHVHAIEKEIQSIKLWDLFRKNKTTFGIGAMGVALANPILTALVLDPTSLKDLIKLLPAGMAAMLHHLLFGVSKTTPPTVKIYNAVFESGK